ncbi:TPA: NAD(P)H-dependent oxidoreductase [Streptococcus equi subsp. zooepidemicus]|uniref:NAD(P)H-dependent oxidoreductase n=1 Tax=Streptococcus equi TaxID=1336 RepID=UPI001E3E51DB|nr:NAD(P)H-dependent oxidoreductase [Streptococcus equi]MCD3438220.1 NAD(P)H-dependent oxidoreductase [Streptococcus equi subsp. zooepidemicus]HEK9074332.1 NAD(P)H-dependent oxidoreductase [Streptococcus equi subsp. zooepidemicus]HEL0000555.1 NAD(P)H-dependent oxidoreductase [Streptococcus equi subsp. zooepidemicus]HEL0415414.1 NAD(P)H-dependent oxidoreductase [Streptococcus equi subsp. zooepidemicus]HEL0429570.1 NAD(P)H-dependent oxidoreductase [Streptococcus equi subsp. zooepidemicus]
MSNKAIHQQLRNAFSFRTAVRVYNDQKIAKEDLDLILDAAWLSPSSIGLEAWRFVVLENEAVKNELKEVSWGATYQFETASHFVLLISEKQARYDGASIKQSLLRRGITDEQALASRLACYEAFQKHDMEIADDPRALFDWTAKQTYIALANMMTTAALIGIDSCPIEGFNYDKVNAILAKHGVINPDTEGIASMLSLGYRLRDPKHSQTRKPREEVISFFS